MAISKHNATFGGRYPEKFVDLAVSKLCRFAAIDVVVVKTRQYVNKVPAAV